MYICSLNVFQYSNSSSFNTRMFTHLISEQNIKKTRMI